jgi:hypothetical protein
MKKIATVLIALYFLVPAFALAAPSFPIGPTPAQLLTRVAALQAQEAQAQAGTSTVSCASLFSAPKVAVGQTVYVAWGSMGALAPGASSTQSMWPQAGASTLSFQKAGTWTYNFTFYGVQGGTATCTASIRVTS